jgi:hypothetical protein
VESGPFSKTAGVFDFGFFLELLEVGTTTDWQIAREYAEAGIGVGFRVVCCFFGLFVHCFVAWYARVPWSPSDLELDVWELVFDLVGGCVYFFEDVFSCRLGPCVMAHDGSVAVDTHGDLDPIEVAAGVL